MDKEQYASFLQGVVVPERAKDPHHLTPDLSDGSLLIDPEIDLICGKLGLAVSFFYNTTSTTDSESGKCRSATWASIRRLGVLA